MCYEYGILTVTGENQALISQLGYLQKQYISKLAQHAELKDLKQIRPYLRSRQPDTPVRTASSQSLAPETQEMLRNAAGFVSDPKLSQALLRLASNKK
ncbi:hypothetical protein ACIRA0001_0369 [Acinetobacter radioresistens SK82]|uniref:DUF721 domain-containing protein n=1 Tax=Acinetobacter radioresistens SK82 TaxID=596318 RepID=A0ABM9YM69_ACIRA|nr:hypothetical protein ACIRA0001_0369 [Acinetobacter radioresistens SK82]EXB35533.1 hypothetical protein J546_0111 [Acinetobacter sp. 1461402]